MSDPAAASFSIIASVAKAIPPLMSVDANALVPDKESRKSLQSESQYGRNLCRLLTAAVASILYLWPQQDKYFLH